MKGAFALSGSLRWKMALLFLAFALLVFVSVAATTWIVETQVRDARIINLAGRQRMLVQQIMAQALHIEKGGGPEHVQGLRLAEATFEQTLEALIAGGQAPYLAGDLADVPPPPTHEVSTALGQERKGWETLRPYLDTIATDTPGAPRFIQAMVTVERDAPLLVERADEVVRQYEAASAKKIALLRLVQGLFLASALVVLAAGFAMIHRSMLGPLNALSEASARIGSGDLNTPVVAQGLAETRALARCMEDMRLQIKSAHTDLETRVARRTRELAALYEVSQEISSHLEIDHVLNSVTGKARELLDSEVAFLCLLDETGQSLEMRAYSGSVDAVQDLRMSIEEPSTERVLSAQAAVACVGSGCHGACRIISSPFRASHQAIPLRVAGQPIGALCVGRSRPDGFTPDEGRLLTKLGQSAAIALENARLYEQSERIAALEERQRIAADMHDGLAQTLSYLELKTERLTEATNGSNQPGLLADLAHLRQTLSQANQDVRRSIAHLQDRSLSCKDLAARLADLVAEAAHQESAVVELIMPAGNPPILPPDQEEQVLRVAGEALQNARRHAGASRISIRLEQEGDQMILMIEDDGCGFDPSQGKVGHFGLSIIQARAARLGGHLSVESSQGKGTQVRLVWPAPTGRAGEEGS